MIYVGTVLFLFFFNAQSLKKKLFLLYDFGIFVPQNSCHGDPVCVPIKPTSTLVTLFCPHITYIIQCDGDLVCVPIEPTSIQYDGDPVCVPIEPTSTQCDKVIQCVSS